MKKVTVNLGCFFYFPRLWLCSLRSLLLLLLFHNHLLLLFLFPTVHKSPNKLAPNVPSNIPKNPPLCSLVLFSIVLVTPFNKIPEFSNASIIFINIFLFNN